MNEILKAIKERRSCKSFKPDAVSDEIIDKIVEAGLFAASGIGMQSPIILAVTDKEVRDKLCALNSKYDQKHRPDPFYGAPAILVVLADKSVPTYVYDGSLVMGNMMLAAHSLDIGSCWIHRAKETFEDEEGKAILKDLGIEGDFEGIANCVIGYPTVPNNKIPPRKENRVFKK